MEAIITILLAATVLSAIFEFTSHSVYGKLLDDETVMDYIQEYGPFEHNPFNESILGPKLDYNMEMEELGKRLKNRSFISTLFLCLSSKYYINGIGRIPRWSHSHKVIKELYKTSE